MIALIRSEFIKLRTVTSHWVIGLIGVAFTFIVVVLSSIFMSLDSGTERSAPATLVSNTAVIMGLLFGTVGVLSYAAEAGHGTIRVTFAAEPRRTRVVAAKAVVLAITTIVVSAITVSVAYAVSLLILDSRDGGPSFSGSGTYRSTLFGAVVLCTLLALLGFALGMMLRSAPLGITIYIIWPLFAEGLIGGLLSLAFHEAVFKFLPYQSGFQMVSAGHDSNYFSPAVSGAYFAAWIAALMALGAWITNTKDA
jgi:ABC-2 type transport system permease protein